MFYMKLLVVFRHHKISLGGGWYAFHVNKLQFGVVFEILIMKVLRVF